MKVGIFLSNINPHGGGGFTFQDDIIASLLKLESKHTFAIFGQQSGDRNKEISNKKIQFIPLDDSFFKQARLNLKRIISSLPLIRRFLRGKNKSPFQQVIEELGIEMVWFLTPDYTKVDIPYIYTVWDLQHRLQPWFPEVSKKGRWKVRERMFSDAIQRASAVIIGAEAGKTEIVHFYGVLPERIRLLPHPTPSFALNASKGNHKEVLIKYKIPEGYLFYPAQFWPHKNHVGLLLAVHLLREKYDLVLPVVFVGSDKGNVHYIRKLIGDLDLTTQVYFLGFVPQEDLIGLYRNAFALTYLTFFGPENVPPLEAFALGCPVIASDVSGAQEQLGKAVLLVDPKDEDQIALAIKSLYDDSALRQRFIQHGLDRAASWTGEDFVKSVFKIIDDFEPILRCWDNVKPYGAGV